MSVHNCELCGQPVRVVGDTTLHYEPVPERLTRPEGAEEHSTQVLSTYHLGVIDRLLQRIHSLETTVLEQADQIESLSAECERYRRVVEQQAARIERLTWRYDDGSRGGLGANSAGRYCLRCGARESYPHAPGCPAGEE